MTAMAESLLQEALALPEPQRVEFAEKLLHSLAAPDPRIDRLWVQEARSRLAAFDAGEMKEVSEEEFFSDSDAA